jgi:hypothetical protein
VPDWLLVLAVIFFVGMAGRALFRFRNHVRAYEEARKIGIIKCKKCGFHGPLLGYANFIAMKRLVCPKCRSNAWERSVAQAPGA